jgi:hypothetical protein
MVTKKSFFVILSLLLISTGLLSFVNGVGAETLICRSETVHDVSKIEPLGDLYYGYFTRVGSVKCTNGEIAEWWSCGYSVLTLQKGGPSQGIIILTFKDSAKIVTLYKVNQRPDPKGEVLWYWEGMGEIIKGTDHFKGIQGNVSISGKQERDHKKTAINEMVITYTLPSK